MADVNLSFSTQLNPQISLSALRIGASGQIITICPTISAVLAVGEIIHQSTFDIVVDRDVTGDMDIIPEIGYLQAVGIEQNPVMEISPVIAGSAFAYRLVHQSVFDVCSRISASCDLAVSVNPITTQAVRGVYCDVAVSPGIVDSGLGVGVRAATASVICNPGVDAEIVRRPGVKFGELKFIVAKRSGADKITSLADDQYVKAGVSTPQAFSRTFSIIAESNSSREYASLLALEGQTRTLFIDDIPYPKTTLQSISDRKIKPALDRWEWEMEFIQYVYSSTDTVTFNGITLSNPTLPNAHDITPQFSVDMGSAYSITDGIPKIVRRWAVECICETPSEFEILVSYIGIKAPMRLNGTTYQMAYISSLSALQPRGGGNIWSYTIEFSQEYGVVPVVASFNNITLPNATYTGGDVEIQKSRTVLHDGRIAADIGLIPSNQKGFTCMSNSESVYTSLYNKIGVKASLIIDGKTYTKCYISSLSDNRVIGSGSRRIYQWDITFEQETA